MEELTLLCPRPEESCSRPASVGVQGLLPSPETGAMARPRIESVAASPRCGRRSCCSAVLQEVSLDNFKSFAHETARIAPFTLLLGANASGKSNFVDALRFLHGMAQGWPIRDVVSGRSEASTKVWQGIRGGTKDLVRAGKSSCRIASSWQILGDTYAHSIETDGAEIHAESIANLFTARLQAGKAGAGGQLGVEWLQGSGVPRVLDAEHAVIPAASSVICSQTALKAPFIPPFRHSLAGMMHFFEPVTAAMRDYVERPAANGTSTEVTAQTVTGMLWRLCQDPARKQELLDWLVEFCAPEITDIGFEETESGYVLLRVTEADGTKVTAKSMSDGTLRFLALLTAVKGSAPGSTLVIEDLELGLHPSRLQLLVDAIAARTQGPAPWDPGKELPVVIATTHSPVLVEAALAIPDASVLLFARTADAEGSIIRDVRTLPGFAEVSKRRDFTYLLDTGWLERAV